MMQGDLGQSYFFNQPVSKLIGERVGATILLVLAAQVIAITIGTAMGVLAARRPNGLFSGVVSVVATIGYAVPGVLDGHHAGHSFCVDFPDFPG